MNLPIQLKTALLPLFIGLVLAWFGLAPASRAVSPAPDGEYSGGNTAEGFQALFNLTTGLGNTALGLRALVLNTTGGFNTATGASALFGNTTGGNNTATGVEALANNTIGDSNTASGAFALRGNRTGFNNTATGVQALVNNKAGPQNTATGRAALFSNTNGHDNTANGFSALHSNTTGDNNTAIGDSALLKNTTGNANTALGHGAGSNLTTGNNNIDIGNLGLAGESRTIRIGDSNHTRTFLAGISGAAVMGATVHVNAAGQLGTSPSSARFKQEIKPMEKASEAILSLKPVTFHYRKEVDPDGVPQFGLVAEDVEKVNPDLVARDGEGKPYSVRYEAVNAMLLNEFLKEHRKVQKLEAALEAINKHLKEQDAKIQKVSAQVEMTKSPPQSMVSNQ